MQNLEVETMKPYTTTTVPICMLCMMFTPVQITILLAVSALYIVIFSSIPMIGTLTLFDDYIITVSGCNIHDCDTDSPHLLS